MWRLLFVLGACGFQLPAAPHDGSVATDESVRPDGDAPQSDWWDAQWRRRRPITIDGTRLTAAVQGFPLHVRIDNLAGARPGGDDLRFVTQSGELLPYEIESWSGPTTSWVWLRTDVTMAATTVWLYYGNPAAPPASDGAAVFADAHVSVHHLGDSLADSTGHGHTAFNQLETSTPTAVDGPYGRARSFDGDDWLDITDGEAPYDAQRTLYVSAWVSVTTFDTSYQAVIAKGDNAWRMSRAATTNNSAFDTTSSNFNNNLHGQKNVNDSQWHFIAGVMDGTRKHLYVDGVVDRSTSYTSQLDNTSASVAIGQNNQIASFRRWKGVIDEVRVSLTPRDPGWIAAEYATMMDPELVAIGAEQTY